MVVNGIATFFITKQCILGYREVFIVYNIF
jgi:hypothetical protein